MRILLNFMTEPLGSSPPPPPRPYMLQADLMLRSTCRHSRTTPSVVCWWAVVRGPRTNSLIWFVLACNHILTECVFRENKNKEFFLDSHSLPFVSRLGRVMQSCLNSAVWVLILDETLFSRPFKTRLSSTFLADTFLTLPRVNSLGRAHTRSSGSVSCRSTMNASLRKFPTGPRYTHDSDPNYYLSRIAFRIYVMALNSHARVTPGNHKSTVVDAHCSSPTDNAAKLNLLHHYPPPPECKP